MLLLNFRVGSPISVHSLVLPWIVEHATDPNGKKWPDCCGFMVLPESQAQWLILRNGSVNVVPAAIALRATDPTWNYEQWFRPTFLERKRRRDASPADST